jgi:hypothetical protein
MSTDLVFINGAGTGPNHRPTRGQLKALCHRAGIRTIHSHDLRYTFIALLIWTDALLMVINALLRNYCLPMPAALTAGIRLKDLAKALEKLDTLLMPIEFRSLSAGSASAFRPDSPAHDERDDDQPPEPIGAPIR